MKRRMSDLSIVSPHMNLCFAVLRRDEQRWKGNGTVLTRNLGIQVPDPVLCAWDRAGLTPHWAPLPSLSTKLGTCLLSYQFIPMYVCTVPGTHSRRAALLSSTRETGKRAGPHRPGLAFFIIEGTPGETNDTKQAATAKEGESIVLCLPPLRLCSGLDGGRHLRSMLDIMGSPGSA